MPEILQSSPLLAECLAAMTGIFPTRAPTDLEVRGAQNYLARLRRRIAKFLDGEGAEPIRLQRPPSQESLWEKIATPVDVQEFTEWATEAELDVTTAVEYPAVVQRSRDFIKALWPVYPDNSLGLHAHELALDELLDVWHIAHTLNDPETLFDDLDSLVLLPDKVAAVKANFPEMYKQIQAMALAQLQPFIGLEGVIEPKKTLSADREAQFRVLLGVAEEDSFEIAQEPPKQKPEPQPQSKQNISEDARTPSETAQRQRIASK